MQIVDQPLENDVLCGRGKVVSNHVGNHRFQIIIAMKLQSYDDASRLGKTEIIFTIVRDILSRGGRFLKKNSNCEWYDSGYLGARSKVAHSIRDALSDRNKGIMFIKEKVSQEMTATSRSSSVAFDSCVDTDQEDDDGDAAADDSSLSWQRHGGGMSSGYVGSIAVSNDDIFDDDFTSLSSYEDVLCHSISPAAIESMPAMIDFLLSLLCQNAILLHHALLAPKVD